MKAMYCCWLLMLCLTGLADMPGNKPREKVTVRVIPGNLQGFTLYSSDDYSSPYSSREVKDSSTFVLQGGYGRPPCITFFGVNKKEIHTDSLIICNEEQGAVSLKLSVQNGKLVSELQSTKKENRFPLSDDSDPSFWGRNKINILVSVALISVLLLIAGYFLKHRKRMAA